MRADQEVGDIRSQQGMIRTWRLLSQYIDTCPADLSLAQGICEVVFIDDAAAGRVDQDGGGFHFFQLGAADQIVRCVRKRAMQ